MAKITAVNNGESGSSARGKINTAIASVETDTSITGDGNVGTALSVDQSQINSGSINNDAGFITNSSIDTLTNKTFDANGTGNSISNIDIADLANGTDGELITWDAAGAPATVAVGTAGQVLTSNGPGAAPTFQAGGGGGGGITEEFRVFQNGNVSLTSGSQTQAQMNTEDFDAGNNFDTVNYEYVVPSDGRYAFGAQYSIASFPNTGRMQAQIRKNGGFSVINYNNSSNTQTLSCVCNTILECTAGDVIEFFVAQTSGSTLTLIGTTDDTFCFGYKLN